MQMQKSIDFHVYSEGGHSFGTRKQELPVDNRIERI